MMTGMKPPHHHQNQLYQLEEFQQVDKAGEVAAKGFRLIDSAILSTIFKLLPC